MTPETRQLEHHLGEATTLMKALAHPVRLLVCCQLLSKEMSVGDIETRLGIKQPRLSRELGKLREEGLLSARRDAKSVFYSVDEKARPRVEAIIDAIRLSLLPPSANPDTASHPNKPIPGAARAGGECGLFALTYPAAAPNRQK